MQNAFGKKQTIPTGLSGILAILLENFPYSLIMAEFCPVEDGDLNDIR